nr:MAG TPA: hypothetical protein [Caudoviricetes sp.]
MTTICKQFTILTGSISTTLKYLESPRRRISPAAGLRLTASEWELACKYRVRFSKLTFQVQILTFFRNNHVYFRKK